MAIYNIEKIKQFLSNPQLSGNSEIHLIPTQTCQNPLLLKKNLPASLKSEIYLLLPSNTVFNSGIDKSHFVQEEYRILTYHEGKLFKEAYPLLWKNLFNDAAAALLIQMMNPIENTFFFMQYEYPTYRYILELNAFDGSEEKLPSRLWLELLLSINYLRKNKAKVSSKENNQALHPLFEILNKLSLIELKSLFVQKIKYNNQWVFFLDCLVFLTQDPYEASILHTIAAWLYHKDLSLITDNTALLIYKSLNAAPFYKVEIIKKGIDQLKVSSASVSMDIRLKQAKKMEFLPDMLNELKQIYALHWEMIRDTPEDYLRCTEKNSWVSLAYYLMLVKLIDSNYYQWLIPTLKHNEDPITKMPLTSYPLSEYILSEKGDQLIFLQNCFRSYEEYGYLYNYNVIPAEVLTKKEQQRIAYAAEKYALAIKNIKPKEEAPPLSIKTIEALKTLLINSLYIEGLDRGDYSAQQQEKTAIAYGNFNAYLEKIALDNEGVEYANLLRQNISYKGNSTTFRTIFNHIVKDYRCVAANSLYLLQLVLDYLPHTSFSKSLEDVITKNKMRAAVSTKIYKEKLVFSSLMAERLCAVLLSILDHPFSYVGKGENIHFLTIRKRVPKGVKKIFDFLKEKLYKNNFQEAHKDFSELELLVEEILCTTSWMRGADTCNWLQLIYNGDFFAENNQKIFNECTLLSGLWCDASIKIKNKSQECISEIVKIMMETPVNSYIQLININLVFSNWLKSNQALEENLLLELRQIQKENGSFVSQNELIKVFFLEILKQKDHISLYSTRTLFSNKYSEVSTQIEACCKNSTTPYQFKQNLLHYSAIAQDLNLNKYPLKEQHRTEAASNVNVTFTDSESPVKDKFSFPWR